MIKRQSSSGLRINSEKGALLHSTFTVLLGTGWLCLLAGFPRPFVGDASAWGMPGGHDFVEYWAAAQLWLKGENPYNRVALLSVEQAVGWPEDTALPMYNPPWTLPLLLLVAWLPFGPAVQLWFFLGSTCLMVATCLLWSVQVPGSRSCLTALLLTLGFIPALVALYLGQISPWLLLGLALHFYGVQRNRDIVAGVGLGLLMIKPHVTYLFWPVALWWALRERRVGIVAGWAGYLGISSALALAWAPGVFADYVTMMTAALPPYAPPTLGTWLQLLADPRQHLPWLKLLPSLFAGLGLLAWLWRRRGSWQWPALASPLLLLSVPTAIYGWSFDFVVLLPVIFEMVASTYGARSAGKIIVLAGFVVFQLLLVAQRRIYPREMFSVWYPLALCALYVWTRLYRRSEPISGVPLGAA